MNLQFWSESKTAIINPAERYTFRLQVRRENGKPAAKLELAVALEGDGKAADLKAPTTITTNRQGMAALTLEAGGITGRYTVTVGSGEGRWKGTLFVSNVEVPYRAELRLTEEQEHLVQDLVRMLFWDKPTVRVLRKFGGGLSGSLVLQVQVVDAAGRNESQVVKIGPSDALGVEAAGYRLLEPTLRSKAASVGSMAECGVQSAIVYSDAGGAKALDAVVPLADFYAANESDEIAQALCAVLGEEGLPRAYACHRVEPRTFREEVEQFLPEHLVVSLAGGTDGCGVYRAGQLPAKLAKELKLSPGEVKNFKPCGKEGDRVVLAGFRISKMQNGDLNLEDQEKRRYKVKVRYDGATVSGFSTGTTVDVVARLVTNRMTRLEFAVRDCLEQAGGTSAKDSSQGYLVAGEIYPDPLALHDSVLDLSWDAAIGRIHGDLHWDNVMLGTPSNWRLIDYGLTRVGPVLFDFIKLELYLRYKELAKDPKLDTGALLAFEQALVENPIGRLPEARKLPTSLAKAAEAIRTIRRLARPYMRNGLVDYCHFLFSYALALAKYYPTPDRWEAAEKDPELRKRCDKEAREFLVALAAALALGRWIRWQQVVGKRPALKLEFVGMGTVLEPRPGIVAVDVGNKCVAGVIDHHFAGGRYGCAAEAVLKQPEFVEKHEGCTTAGEVVWVTHSAPDFDAVASTWLAWHRVHLGYFPPGSAALVAYANTVDAGTDFLETVPFPARTPYALFMLHLAEVELRHLTPSEVEDRDRGMMANGFAVLDYLCRMEVTGVHALASNLVPHENGFWRATAGRDEEMFEVYDLRPERRIQVALGAKKPVAGLVIDSPRSLFFKAWARRRGIPLLIVRHVQPEKQDHRIVVSVRPTMKEALAGLGAALERAESDKRRKEGKVRPPPPRWEGVDNNDPWYDGRSHEHTIVDAPREGTVLTLEEVAGIVTGGGWES